MLMLADKLKVIGFCHYNYGEVLMMRPHVIYFQNPILKIAKFIVFDQIVILPSVKQRHKVVKVSIEE